MQNPSIGPFGEYILGLDLGPSSIGWAIIKLDQRERPCKIFRTGVRRFEAGVLGDIEAGRDESRATARREARGPRRNAWRRQWRMKKLFRKLQNFGLLPESDDDSPDARHELLQKLDAELMQQFPPETHRIDGHLLPYRLRAIALDEELPPHAVGRAIYHLGQRRGFLSNRKAQQDDEETGVLKTGISELHAAIDDANCRTLGEYFATLDPEEARIRSRWTARSMFEHEFEEIWKAQAAHHPCMTTEAKEQIKDAIFFQRPLKSQKGLIGLCDLEPYKRRAPLACLPAQRFRIWQKLNDLRLFAPDGSQRDLAQPEKELLFERLSETDKLTWHKVRQELKLKKSKEYGRGWTFNFEESGDKTLIGNRTAAKMVEKGGEAWKALSSSQQEELVDEMLSFESEEALAKRLESGWKFDSKSAMAVAGIRFEQDNTNLSRKAIAKLLPLLQQGIAYSTARKKIYGESFEAKAALDDLPPVKRSRKDGPAAFPSLRNPAVERAMSELRKVVNAIIHRYGKPALVRIELARDLKHARNRREEMTKNRDKNTRAREQARTQILREMGEKYISAENILKIRLAEECSWTCPFTGRSISMRSLVGDSPQFDIEHIIPFSRCLDNSFLNKTLCYHEENRNVKKNQTPWEAYRGTEKYEEILLRVRRFQGDARGRKLMLFETEKLPDAEEFTQRQLSETRYISRLASELLSLLYGGKADAEGKLRVQVSPGRATAYLRQRWNLNSIIGHADEKNRADHRHHAIDAIVIGLTSPGAVKLLCEAAERAEETGMGLFAEVDLPWETFLDEASASIEAINVSSRVGKKLNGKLHKDTIFSKPHLAHDAKGKEIAVHHVRKRLEAMSSGEVEQIVDPVIRRLVQEKLAAHGGSPDKVFKEKANFPHLASKKDPSRLIPIYAARIRKPDRPISVGQGSSRRYVNPGSNHHMEIVAVVDDEGNEKKWEGIVVSQFDAMQRKRNRQPIIQRDHGQGKLFKFSLAGGEHIEMEDGAGNRNLYRVSVISDGQIEMLLHTDARPITVRKKIKGARVRSSPDALRKACARKVTIDPLGEIHPARD